MKIRISELLDSKQDHVAIIDEYESEVRPMVGDFFYCEQQDKSFLVVVIDIRPSFLEATVSPVTKHQRRVLVCEAASRLDIA